MDNNFESNYVKLEQSDIHIVFAPQRIIPLRQALAVRGLEPNEDEDAGKISMEIAKSHAESEFEKYRIVQGRLYTSDFDKLEAEGDFHE